MQISNIIQDSYQEYEDYQSVVLFTSGCNLACPWCHNRSRVNGCLDDVDLHKCVTPLTEAVVFLGGEPLLHNIKEVVLDLKRSFPWLLFKVFTNGLEHKKLEEVLSYIDAVSIDVKCVRDSWRVLGVDISDKYYLSCLDQSISACYNGGVDVEVRTTISEYNDSQTDEIGRWVVKNYPTINHVWQKDSGKR